MNIEPKPYFMVIYDEDGNVIDVQPAPEQKEVVVEHLGPLADHPIEINSIKITEVMTYIPKRRTTKRKCKQIHSGCQLWQV